MNKNRFFVENESQNQNEFVWAFLIKFYISRKKYIFNCGGDKVKCDMHIRNVDKKNIISGILLKIKMNFIVKKKTLAIPFWWASIKANHVLDVYLTFHPIFFLLLFLSCSFSHSRCALIIFDSSSRTLLNILRRARIFCLHLHCQWYVWHRKGTEKKLPTHSSIICYRHMTICIHVIFHDVIYSLSVYHCIAHFNKKNNIRIYNTLYILTRMT